LAWAADGCTQRLVGTAMNIVGIDVDRQASTVYIYFSPPTPGISARQVNIGDSVIFDLSKDGELVGLEILDPRLSEQFTHEGTIQALGAAKIPVVVQG